MKLVWFSRGVSIQALTAAEDGTIIVWDMTTYTSILSINESTIFRVGRGIQRGRFLN